MVMVMWFINDGGGGDDDGDDITPLSFVTN
jgi:hypothetical protein